MADQIEDEISKSSSSDDEVLGDISLSKKKIAKRGRIQESSDESDGDEDDNNPITEKKDQNSDDEKDSNDSDNDESKEDDEVVTEGSKVSGKRKHIISDDSDDEDDDDRDSKKESDKDSEDSEDDEKVDKDEKGLQEDDEGEDEDEDNQKEDKNQDEDEDDDDEPRKSMSSGVVYDFDIMMAKKKEENSRKRKRRNYEIINDNDDIIADIITQMKEAVESDIAANQEKRVATGKLKLLPFVMNQLRKIDLRDAFLDSDVLSVMTEWLAPLPDRSLPHLNIREGLLKILLDFNLYDVDRIKGSGIGKAVMYLSRHPKETRENKQRAKQLISAWSRPIFNLDTSFNAISREEREERDKELQRRSSKNHESSADEDEPTPTPRRSTKEETNQPPPKPGDNGWIPRARVPAPSMRDYVIRPRSKVDGDIGRSSKRPANMLEKLMKTHQDRRRASKQQRAVNMKIDKL